MELMEFVDGYPQMGQILQNVFYLKNVNKLPVQTILSVVNFQVHVLHININYVLVYQFVLVMVNSVSQKENVKPI